MNIFNNFKSLLFCFNSFGVRHSIDVLDLKKQPGSGKIRTGTGSGSVALGHTEDI